MAMRFMRALAPAVRCWNQRLSAQPQPGQFDRLAAGAPVARLADPLFAAGRAAAPGAWRQPDVAADLAAVVEVLVQRLVDQRPGRCQAQALELAQLGLLLRH